MTLKEFIEGKELSYRKAADFFDIDHALLFKYTKGDRVPSLKNVLKIITLARGLITLEELYAETSRNKEEKPRKPKKKPKAAKLPSHFKYFDGL